MESEAWKEIQGYEGLYKISDNGRVFSVTSNKPRKLCMNEIGYHIVVLYKNNKPKTVRVARLVALHFVDNPDGKPEVNHIDGVKINNRKENLEWVTHSENGQHAWDTKLNKGNAGRKWKQKEQRFVKLTIADIKQIKALIGSTTQKKLAERFNVSDQSIYKIKTGKRFSTIFS